MPKFQMGVLDNQLCVNSNEAGMFNGNFPSPPSHMASNFSLPGISPTGILGNSQDLGISRASGTFCPAGISGIPVPWEIPIL